MTDSRSGAGVAQRKPGILLKTRKISKPQGEQDLGINAKSQWPRMGKTV